MGPTNHPKGSPNASQIGPKLKKHLWVQVRIRHRFCMYFGGSKTSISMLSPIRHTMFEILRMSRKYLQLGSKKLLKRSSGRSRRLQKLNEKVMRKLVTIFNDFGSVLGAPRPPFGSHLGSKMAPKPETGATWDLQVVLNEPQGTPGPSQERFRTEFLSIWDRFCKKFSSNKNKKTCHFALPVCK